jgi:hypothetical protein
MVKIYLFNEISEQKGFTLRGSEGGVPGRPRFAAKIILNYFAVIIALL